jgi:hypothetical protein
MPEFEKTEFEFPDEKSEDKVKVEISEDFDDIEIEVVDDTPAEDRGRKPMETPPEDPTDEELASYKPKERNKIREFHRAYHDERRAKEAAAKEKEEALLFAKALVEENNKLKGSVNESHSALLEQAKRNVAVEIQEAKKKYKEAFESGDSDAMVEAQDLMTSTKLKSERLDNFKPKPLQEDENQLQTSLNAKTDFVDHKAENWKRANSWWGQDREMTGFALALHEKLVVEDGVSPQSDEYYQRIDGRLRQVFPEKFASEKPAETSQRPKANVVASATRSVSAKKITLSPREVNIAKRLGVPIELYARKVAELRRN